MAGLSSDAAVHRFVRIALGKLGKRDRTHHLVRSLLIPDALRQVDIGAVGTSVSRLRRAATFDATTAREVERFANRGVVPESVLATVEY